MIRDGETKKWGSDENGAVAVEFAIIVILLLIIIFGVLEFSFIFYQRHFIENAAREGMRIGIRADNYSCFNGLPVADCTASVDRKIVVQGKVEEYLATLYEPADIDSVDVERVDATKSLKVTARVNNFFPQLLSGLVPGFANQTILSYSITGIYEDPDEYDNED